MKVGNYEKLYLRKFNFQLYLHVEELLDWIGIDYHGTKTNRETVYWVNRFIRELLVISRLSENQGTNY